MPLQPARRTRAALLACLAVATTGIATAQPDRALIQAAIFVTTFDRLDDGCAGRYTATQREQVQRWQADNGVDAMRSRTTALRADPSFAAQVDRAAQLIVQMAHSKGADDCRAAASLTQLPDARFGRELAAAPAPVSPPPALAPTAPPLKSPTTPSTVPPAAPVAAATLEQIDSFAFDTRPKMGMGGFIALDIFPVVLFKSGEVLKDVSGLRYAGGMNAHRSAHADDWSRWRRQGGKVQVLKNGQWEDLPFDNTYARLPADLRLAGRFRSTSGVGNIAVGGQQSVTVVDEYRFAADGGVVRSGAVGSTAQAGDTSVVTRGGSGERRGRYRTDGLLLRIDYEDGSREQRVLITDPKKPGGVLWLDGESYVERR
ncbi:hypothetical protein [Pelomonas cellulosilytica]|uniref:Peptidoglycan binding-like domain-containing protein n=1 Tax=Pelomonas cellulosilytica TaxID=2906762 RepID=A0ABS8XWJ3_9BURK|nr:hypothetical protein [Pelomonas sp. P8]MCE4557027.1 hypothetical protein [Pelomonas sp. P8]